MGIQYTKNITTYIEQLFTGAAIVEDSSLLIPSPFKSLLLPQQNIAFHIVSLNAPIINNLQSTFFYEWSNHAQQQGLHPVHIWEDRWLSQKEVIQSQITSLAQATDTIFARNTIAQRITQPQANMFLNQHHLNGSPHARYKYGLFHKNNNELMAVATFSAPRKFIREGKEYRSFELIRYGSKIQTTLAGGLSKLLKNFINEVKPDDIMTYVDCDWWTGKSYKLQGFKETKLMPPIEFWLKPTENIRFTNSQIINTLGNKLTQQTNKKEVLQQEGYIRVYNSGSRKFLLKIK